MNVFAPSSCLRIVLPLFFIFYVHGFEFSLTSADYGFPIHAQRLMPPEQMPDPTTRHASSQHFAKNKLLSFGECNQEILYGATVNCHQSHH